MRCAAGRPRTQVSFLSLSAAAREALLKHKKCVSCVLYNIYNTIALDSRRLFASFTAHPVVRRRRAAHIPSTRARRKTITRHVVAVASFFARRRRKSRRFSLSNYGLAKDPITIASTAVNRR